MWSGILMLVIAFIVLLIAIGMKVVAKVSDSRTIFQLSVIGFIVIYILAALSISWLNPSLPRANVNALSDLFAPAPTEEAAVPGAPQDVIIRE